MTPDVFNDLLAVRFQKLAALLGKKAGEYAHGGDRLANFRRAAPFLKSTPERALLGMLTKHLVSIADMVDDLERDFHHPAAKWEEKLEDAVAYLLLLEGLLAERYGG